MDSSTNLRDEIDVAWLDFEEKQFIVNVVNVIYMFSNYNLLKFKGNGGNVEACHNLLHIEETSSNFVNAKAKTFNSCLLVPVLSGYPSGCIMFYISVKRVKRRNGCGDNLRAVRYNDTSNLRRGGFRGEV
jgi:hypothetical protein